VEKGGKRGKKEREEGKKKRERTGEVKKTSLKTPHCPSILQSILLLLM